MKYKGKIDMDRKVDRLIKTVLYIENYDRQTQRKANSELVEQKT